MGYVTRTPTISLADDDRGRVPFALIGVLLLVSSITLVGALQSRPTPKTDVDPAVAMDRTTAATQTAIRHAVLDATDQVASEPIIEPANTPYGDLVNASSDREILENYLALRIYLNVQTNLAGAGQNVRGTTTTVSVLPANDLESLERGMDRVTVSADETGRLDVTIDGVRTTVERDGEVIASRAEPVAVSVPTPLFELQRRTAAYETALNTGALEGSGFGRQFSGRLYPLAWARGYAQYAGMPVSEVIANRHVEVTANSAAYATQRGVFGTQDVDGGDAMRQAWLCLAAKDGDDLYGGYNDGESPSIDSQDVCDSLQYVYGDQVGGNPPEAPSLQDLSGHAPGMDEEQTIAVSESAYMPLRHMFDEKNEHSIPAAFDRVYTVDAASSVTVDETHTRAEPAPPDEGAHWERLDRSPRTYRNTTVTDVTVRDPGRASAYYTYDATVVNGFERTASWNDTRTNETERIETNATARSTFDVRVRLYEADHSPDSRVKARTEYGVHRKYGGTGVYSSDFSDVPDRAANAFVGSRTEAGFERLVSDAAVEAHSGADLERSLEIPSRKRLDADYEYGVLEADVIEDLTAIQADIESLEVTFERADMIKEPGEDGPVEDLVAKVEAERDASIDRRGPYVDPAEKAMYEARLAYFELLLSDLEAVAETHDDVMAGLDDELEEANSGLGDATAYMQEAMSTSEPDPEPIQEVPLLEGVSYRVSGSPSYLVTENVTAERVPAVGNDSEFAPMATRNANYFSIPYDSVMTGILSKIPRLDLGEEEQRVPMRTAGETLRAAKLAEAVGADLDGEISQIEDQINQEITTLSTEIANDINSELFGEKEVNIWDSIESTIKQKKTVDMAAIELGEGNLTESITEQIADDLAEEYPSEFSGREGAWKAKVTAVSRPIISEKIAGQSVSFGSGLEEIDAEIRAEVEQITDEVIKQRLENAEIVNEEGEIVIDEEEEWLQGDAPKRVPAGIPITPVPGYWVATANVWNVNVASKYARFEVTSNTGTPLVTGGTTYVREDKNVSVNIGGNQKRLGSNKAISFRGSTVVVIVVPPGGQGVGDRTGVRTECTETWPDVGYLENSETAACGK
ncbi:DUF7286 family protein [Natronosalvus halobius]|uniref:DUF7286 family protein n=1 Tax=Natronosalvus halobius TaxID=2953746 RepID=UPI0020A1FAA5|nr:hypothetical protein [Natronosalvus halobius]USZ72849.1 hypothetical protein NGM15_05965 [Natronosalvus halobius]